MEERRIGTRERELAMGALDEHHRDGRLTTAEYTERSTAAAGARVRSELDGLFDDLPEPHPVYPGDRAVAPTDGAASAGSAAEMPELPELELPPIAVLARNAGKFAAFTPVIAFGLFALTGFRFPLVLLLVPVAFAVLGWVGHRYGN